jgi:hypothetical protein
LGQNPALTNKIVALGPQEIFILASQSEIFIDHIRDTETRPFVGESAAQYALNVLRAEHIQAAVQREIATLLAKARGTVRFNKDFQLKPPVSQKAAKTG